MFTIGTGSPETLESATSTYHQCTGTSPETSCYDQMTMVSVDSNGVTTPLVLTSIISSSAFNVVFLGNGTWYPSPRPSATRDHKQSQSVGLGAC